MTHFKSVDINRLLAITLFWLLTLAYSPNLLGQRIIANNEAQNILYVGIANPVSICAESISCDQLKAYGNGKELKLESCKTVIIPDKKGTFVIEVFHKGGKIGDAYFRILALPPPTIRIGTIENGKIKLKDIIAFGGIRAGRISNFRFIRRLHCKTPVWSVQQFLTTDCSF